MNDNIALIGNPNCGKTTLFNALTGTYQKTGNWTGVTTEKKEGLYRKNKKINIVDLPGLYSLSKGSADENAVLEYLDKTPPKVIVNIVDGTNLERNLFLTIELAKLNIPIVIAVNMCDDLAKNGIKLNEKVLSELLGAPVVLISALKGLNIELLINKAIETLTLPKMANLALKTGDSQEIYEYIESNIDKIITKKQTKAQKFTEKADNILTHKIWGIPIFLAVITLIYFLSIKVGGYLGSYITLFFDNLVDKTTVSLQAVNVQEWLISLICKAIFNGVGTVLSFLPQVLVLFALMTVIEQSGYASRIAFNLDRLFRAFGLNGKSIIPMILSCGCTVTGLTATRTIESEKEKKMTVFLCPLMPCSAKMAVFGWFSYKFFDGMAFIATSMYFLSIVSVAILGSFLKRFKSFKEDNGGFILEMPTLRPPSIKDILSVLWEKTKDFIAKAGSIIFIVSVVLWALMNLGVNGYTNGIIEQSFLYYVGNLIKYFFAPLGFGSWQASVAVITGVLAKEAVIESLEITCAQNVSALFVDGWSVYAFMSFVLLSPPCIASIAMAKRELKSVKTVAFMLCFQLIFAYIVVFIINGIGFLLRLNLILSAIIVIMITVIFMICIFTLKSRKCRHCTACKKGEGKCPENIKRNTI